LVVLGKFKQDPHPLNVRQVVLLQKKPFYCQRPKITASGNAATEITDDEIKMQKHEK